MFLVVFFITILVLVIIHELGHYFAARFFNIKALEFGFGLPPRIWGKQIGETLWSINALPFGGFVRLLGEDETNKKALADPRSFAAANVWKRILVVIAGVSMNLILAWILFWILVAAQKFRVELPLIVPHQFVGAYQSTEKVILINDVSKDSPAQAAGIKTGDRIIAFNGQPISDADVMIKETKANAGKPVELTLSDPQKTTTRVVEITPRVNPPEGQGSLGVSLGGFQFAILEYRDPWQKLFAGPIHSYNYLAYSVKVIGSMISTSVEQKRVDPVAHSLGGPIAIAVTIREILKFDTWLPVLELAAAMSLVLAFMNVLPIPALDGGRLLFLVIEAVTGKKVPAYIEAKIHAAGMVFLLLLIFVITYKDIRVYIFNMSPF